MLNRIHRSPFICAMACAASLLSCEEGAPPNASSGPLGLADDTPVEFAPPAARMQRLTQPQYAAAIKTLFGDDILVPQAIEPDVSIDGFIAVGATRTSISARGVEQYQDAAFDIADQVFDDPDRRARVVACEPSAECAESTIADIGALAWRRPLSETEMERLMAVHLEASGALGDFWQAIKYPVAAILQSPKFLFRVELGIEAPADPETPEAATDLTYSSEEMAARLAFFLWNAPPDADLLAAGSRGDLADDDKLAARVAEMLDDPRARDGVRNFFSEYLHLHLLDQMVKDPTVFVHTSPELADSAREETLRTVEHLVFEEDGDYRDIMTSRRTFIDRRLAALYDVQAPSADAFELTWLPEAGYRRGLLGHASFLALQSHAESSSATLRGKFVRITLLCDELPPPPADVDPAIPEPSPDLPTLRDRVQVHLENLACAGCHRPMDLIGLALENYDGIGRYRETERGATIDASGELDGITFDDAQGLAWAVREHPNFGRCITQQLYRYATGLVEQPTDEVLIDALAEGFAAEGYRLKALLAAIATSPGFRRATEAAE